MITTLLIFIFILPSLSFMISILLCAGFLFTGGDKYILTLETGEKYTYTDETEWINMVDTLAAQEIKYSGVTEHNLSLPPKTTLGLFLIINIGTGILLLVYFLTRKDRSKPDPSKIMMIQDL